MPDETSSDSTDFDNMVKDIEARSFARSNDELKKKNDELEKRLTAIENRERKRVNTPWGVYDKGTANFLYIVLILTLIGIGGGLWWTYTYEKLWFAPLP